MTGLQYSFSQSSWAIELLWEKAGRTNSQQKRKQRFDLNDHFQVVARASPAKQYLLFRSVWPRLLVVEVLKWCEEFRRWKSRGWFVGTAASFRLVVGDSALVSCGDLLFSGCSKWDESDQPSSSRRPTRFLLFSSHSLKSDRTTSMQSNTNPSQQITTQSVILQLQQAAQNQPPPQQQPPQPQSTQSGAGGVTTTQKHSSDGDDQYRNAK